MKRRLAMLATALATIAGAATAQSSVTGTATYLERIAVGPDVTFTAQLLDVSQQDIAATELGSTMVSDVGNPPYQFEINYEDSEIEESSRYVVRAELRREGTLLFTTDTAYPVLTYGAGSHVDMVLVKVAASEDAILRDGTWDIVSLRDMTVPVLDENRPPRFSILDDGAAWGATVGCNQMRGALTFGPDGTIEFGLAAATMMLCAPPLDTAEAALGTVLVDAVRYQVSGDRLELLDAEGATIAVFEATDLA